MSLDLKKLLETLQAIEFSVHEGDSCSVCPSCWRCAHRHGDQAGHSEKCELAAAIRDVQKELADQGLKT